MTEPDTHAMRALRNLRGLTIPQMAELLNTPAKTYQNWELGRTRPPGCLLVALRCLEKHPPERKL